MHQCPKCHSVAIVKKGFTQSGNQRYLCNKCKKRFTLEKSEYNETVEKMMKKKENSSILVNKLTFDGEDAIKKSTTHSQNKIINNKPKQFKLKSLVNTYLQNIESICECCNRINVLLYDKPTQYDHTKYNGYLVLNDKKLTLGKLTNIIQATNLFYDIFSYTPVDHITNLINMIGDSSFELDNVSIVEEFCKLQKQLENGQTNFELVSGCHYLNDFNDVLTRYNQYLESIHIRLMDFVEE